MLLIKRAMINCGVEKKFVVKPPKEKLNILEMAEA
jgi:hypothetical protein